MTFAEIYKMLVMGSYNTTKDTTIMECATRIYIKQMEIEALNSNSHSNQKQRIDYIGEQMQKAREE